MIQRDNNRILFKIYTYARFQWLFSLRERQRDDQNEVDRHSLPTIMPMHELWQLQNGQRHNHGWNLQPHTNCIAMDGHNSCILS